MPLNDSATAVKNKPQTRTARTACEDAFLTPSLFPAPFACEINARKPTLTAETVLPMSQFTVVVEPTAAVASVPREPTIAVSIY